MGLCICAKGKKKQLGLCNCFKSIGKLCFLILAICLSELVLACCMPKKRRSYFLTKNLVLSTHHLVSIYSLRFLLGAQTLTINFACKFQPPCNLLQVGYAELRHGVLAHLSMKQPSLFVLYCFLPMRSTESGCFRLCSWSLWKLSRRRRGVSAWLVPCCLDLRCKSS